MVGKLPVALQCWFKTCYRRATDPVYFKGAWRQMCDEHAKTWKTSYERDLQNGDK